MSAELSNPNGDAIATPTAAASRPVHIWVPLVFVATFWTVPFITKWLDLPIYAGFFTSMGSVAVLTLVFTIWWLTSGGARFRDRSLVWLALFAVGFLAVLLADKSIGAMGLAFFGFPVAISFSLVWLLCMRKRSAAVRNGGMLAVFAIACGLNTLVRLDGVDGNQQAAVRWRWGRTAEDL